MNNDETWVMFETETDGMKRPFHVLEIAAQRMRGYEPEGVKFRVLLNHEVPIDIHAQAVHGYTQEHLRQHGQEPKLAHSLFRDYVGSRPVVSHNLPMDWNRYLAPECERLGIPTPGVRGFCALALARRVLPEASSFALSALNKRYRLVEGDLRGAAPDVEAVARLFQHWFGPRLTAAGIVGFDAVAQFSRRTPPAKCRELVAAAVKNQVLPVPSTTPSPPPSPASVLEEFNQLVRDIMADGVMTTAEFLILMDWLRDCPHTDVYPVNRLQEAVERVTAQDGQVTAEDQERLEKAFKYYLETGKAPPRPGEAGTNPNSGATTPQP
jgi:DNA polymerase III epsilon subunit-like protein